MAGSMHPEYNIGLPMQEGPVGTQLPGLLRVLVFGLVLAAVACQAEPATEDVAVEATARGFADARVPLNERRAGLRQLAHRGDAFGVRVLMQVANQPDYLNWAAVEALGECKGDSVEAFLTSKLGDADARLLSYAARSLATVAHERAHGRLLDALVANRHREDGLEEGVQTAIVQAVTPLHLPAVGTALVAELARAAEPGWSYEYGSALVLGLAQNPAVGVREALTAYGQHLQTQLLVDDATRPYFEAKLTEVQRAQAGL